jgi:hypothetical protein
MRSLQQLECLTMREYHSFVKQMLRCNGLQEQGFDSRPLRDTMHCPMHLGLPQAVECG